MSVALVFLGGCDEMPTAPTTVELAGRWQVLSLEPRNAAAIVPGPGVMLAIEFAAGDRVSLQGDCNVCSGSYALSGRAFSATRLICTLRACREGTIENPFFQIVTSADAVTLAASSRLRLSGPEGLVDLGR
ncbi:MAG: META domain-containing protein [Acidobacteriota bacterium]